MNVKKKSKKIKEINKKTQKNKKMNLGFLIQGRKESASFDPGKESASFNPGYESVSLDSKKESIAFDLGAVNLFSFLAWCKIPSFPSLNTHPSSLGHMFYR